MSKEETARLTELSDFMKHLIPNKEDRKEGHSITSGRNNVRAR
jgi:hypothetical protein